MEGDPTAPKGGVTAWIYQRVLERHLPPILGFGNIFMRDNAPIHKAYIIRDWFRERGIEVMEWPPFGD